MPIIPQTPCPTGNQRYETAAEAWRVIPRLRVPAGHVFRCGKCHGWHLAHSRFRHADPGGPRRASERRR